MTNESGGTQVEGEVEFMKGIGYEDGIGHVSEHKYPSEWSPRAQIKLQKTMSVQIKLEMMLSACFDI